MSGSETSTVLFTVNKSLLKLTNVGQDTGQLGTEDCLPESLPCVPPTPSDLHDVVSAEHATSVASVSMLSDGALHLRVPNDNHHHPTCITD